MASSSADRASTIAMLVPVSSTVIPLPVYNVGFSLGLPKGSQRGASKPDEPIKLITAQHKKKATSAGNKDKTSGAA